MNLSEDLAWRGLIKDKTFYEIGWLDHPRTFYMGIDASAPSLTVGNLAFILLGRRLADAGWGAVLLAGGGTTLIGDPGGKIAERELIGRETVQENIAGIKGQMTKLFEGENFQLVDNFEWLSGLKYLDFLREVGKLFPMSELMQREFVTERLGAQGSGISYAEFSYSLVQGYDFWHLFKNHNVELQIGGSDQWGNMLSGVSMIRKKEGKEAHALSMPLVVNKETGQKFGKSEGGAVWLDPAKTSPTEFYQFWINTSDADVESFLKIFTMLSKGEIEKVMAKQHADPSSREAQKRLAEEVTALVHGGAQAASSVSQFLTGQEPIESASAEDIEQIKKEIPHAKSSADGSIISALSLTGLASSNSEARRLLDGGAVYVNGSSVSKENFEMHDFNNGRLILRRGKAYKDSALIELE